MSAPATPSFAEQVLAKLETMQKSVETIGTRQDAQDTQMKTLGEQFAKAMNEPAINKAGLNAVLGHEVQVRQGEDIMGSRGLSLLRMIGCFRKKLDWKENGKMEAMVCGMMEKALTGNGLYKKEDQDTILFPVGAECLPEDICGREMLMTVKEMSQAGISGADPGYMKWLISKCYQNGKYTGVIDQSGLIKKDTPMSFQTDTLGGALVKPPEQGEVIPLIRNKQALAQAGARTVPLPPQGKIVYPRQTSPGTATWLGENNSIPSSTLGTGEVVLSGKKLAVRIIIPNELLRFASPAAEALVRDDMTKDLALGLDLAGLEGAGGNIQPQGVVTYDEIVQVQSTSQTPAGWNIVPQDIYKLIYAVEERNFDFEGFIMRPRTLYNYYMQRWSAVTAGDQEGGFVFDLIRDPATKAKAVMGGFPVFTSTQVSLGRSLGSANNLTYIIGGMWSELMIGVFGAMEFAASGLGDGAFSADQTHVRGILTADVAPRYPGAYSMLDTLILA